MLNTDIRSNKEVAEDFDRQRNNYLFRREFSDYALDEKIYSAEINSDLATLGFEIS